MSDIPAFPSPNNVKAGDFVTNGHQGMTLRDYFAGQALAGYFAAPHTPHHCEGSVVATYVYGIADAMLAERAKVRPVCTDMQHVACFDEGEFQWLSGITPRDCELFAPRKATGK